MFRSKKHELRQLIESFSEDLGENRSAELSLYVDHGECGLAVELLSDWIYEADITVSPVQESSILRSSRDFGVDPQYHAFLGRSPPYPDLRTPEQRNESMQLSTPTLDNVARLAKSNQKLIAIQMYRELTGAGLNEAADYVERVIASSPG